MIAFDLKAGHGVGVIDPHGDLAEAVLRRIPRERTDQLVVFDASDEGNPPTLNLFQAVTAREQDRAIED